MGLDLAPAGPLCAPLLGFRFATVGVWEMGPDRPSVRWSFSLRDG